MKQFWRKIIFADHPAQGAFFALWLLMLGSYILFSLLLLVIAGDWCQVSLMRQKLCVTGWAAAQLGLIGYYTAVNWSFWGSEKCRTFPLEVLIAVGSMLLTAVGLIWLRGQSALPGWLLLIVWLLFAPAAATVGGGVDCWHLLRQRWGYSRQLRLTVIVVAGVILLLPLLWLAGWVSWLEILSGVGLFYLIARVLMPRWRPCLLVWAGAGALGLLTAGIIGLAYMVNFLNYNNNQPLSYVVVESPVMMYYLAHPWIYPAAILAALVVGALLYGNMLAVAAGVSWRSLWRKPLFLLLVGAAAAYLLFGLAALVSQKQLRQTREALGQRFGHAISLEAMSQYYGYPDLAAGQARWEKLTAAWDQLSELAREWIYPYNPAAYVSPEIKQIVRDFLGKHPEEIQAWQNLMPQPGMRYPQNFDRKKIESADDKFQNPLSWPMADLCLYRLALAADRRDKAAAAKEFQLLQNWVDYLKEYFPVGYYCHRRSQGGYFNSCCSCYLPMNEDDDYLKAIDILSGACLYSPEDWAAVTARLIQREKEILQRKDALAYMLCVRDQESYNAREYGKLLPSPRQIRWFLPAVWYYYTRDLMRAWEVSGDEKLRPRWAGGNLVYNLLQFRLEQLRELDANVRSRIARLRVAQGVVQVAVFRQQHGVYPESMPDLPPDPYSGKPLRYDAHATQAFEFRFWQRTRRGRSWNSTSSIEELPVIRVWSVGPNQKDDRGLNNWQQHADDISAVIRLDLEKKP